MPRALMWGLGLLLLASGCAESTGPRAGDTVSPQLVGNASWQPGTGRNVTVQIAATDTSGRTRALGFFMPSSMNPVADIEFFDADGESIGSEEKTLSHRC